MERDVSVHQGEEGHRLQNKRRKNETLNQYTRQRLRRAEASKPLTDETKSKLAKEQARHQ